jgi:hypothetical protein
MTTLEELPENVRRVIIRGEPILLQRVVVAVVESKKKHQTHTIGVLSLRESKVGTLFDDISMKLCRALNTALQRLPSDEIAVLLTLCAVLPVGRQLAGIDFSTQLDDGGTCHYLAVGFGDPALTLLPGFKTAIEQGARDGVAVWEAIRA